MTNLTETGIAQRCAPPVGSWRADYARLSDVKIDADSLRWYEGVVCLRALSEVAEWVAAGTADARAGHPWIVSGPAFATRLSALTGATVRSR